MDIKEALTKKIGPLPVWVYGLAGVGAVLILAKTSGVTPGDSLFPLPHGGAGDAGPLPDVLSNGVSGGSSGTGALGDEPGITFTGSPTTPDAAISSEPPTFAAPPESTDGTWSGPPQWVWFPVPDGTPIDIQAPAAAPAAAVAPVPALYGGDVPTDTISLVGHDETAVSDGANTAVIAPASGIDKYLTADIYGAPAPYDFRGVPTPEASAGPVLISGLTSGSSGISLAAGYHFGPNGEIVRDPAPAPAITPGVNQTEASRPQLDPGIGSDPTPAYHVPSGGGGEPTFSPV